MVLIIAVITLAIDQITKLLATNFLKGKGPIKLIQNNFSLYYVENKGAAFGIMENGIGILILSTSILLVFLIVFTYNNYSNLSRVKKVSFGLLIGGALGNLVDRIRLGYVVDFLSLRFFNSRNFPVFNFADVFVVIATIMIIIILFFDDEFL